MIPSESRGIAIPHTLTNATVPGKSLAGTYTNIGDAQVSSYTQGTGVTVPCDSDINGNSSYEGNPSVWLNASSPLHTYGAGGTGVNASDQAINNVVREARALSNGTTTDY